jgi:hypothetical protein
MGPWEIIMQPLSAHAAATLAAAMPSRAPTAGQGVPSTISVIPGPTASASLPPDRRGRLKNGACGGDFLAAPRCGARTRGVRAGGCCQQPAMKNGRCRMHGGFSTGPRTAEGLERCRQAPRTHGAYTAENRALMTAASVHIRRMRVLLAQLGLARPTRGATVARRAAGQGVPSRTPRSSSQSGAHPARREPAPGGRRDRLSSSSALCGAAVLETVTAGHGLPSTFFDFPADSRPPDRVAP